MRTISFLLTFAVLLSCNQQNQKINTEENNESTQSIDTVVNIKENITVPDNSFSGFMYLFGSAKGKGKIPKEFSEKFLDGSEYYYPGRILLNDSLVILEIKSELSVGLAWLALYDQTGKKIDVEDVGCEGDCDTKIELDNTEPGMKIKVSHSSYDPTDETTNEWENFYKVTRSGIELVQAE